ncbi:MAG: restriction endonuclease [Synergistaceae bacterium]|jgi:restriction system protein|nr:restriction endonuclease [Synergistaceae bacterium]
MIINREHAQFINWIPPFLEVLKEKGGSATTKEVRDGIAEKMKLSDEFLMERYDKSGQLRFNNQVYWAKQYLTWDGFVSTSKRGIWSLTDKGLETSLNYDEALTLFNRWVKIHNDARKAQNDDPSADVDTEQEYELESEIEAEDSLPLIEVLKKTTPIGFENLCGRLLREYDFEDIKITQRSHDGGIDGIAILKLNPFVNMSVYFQCKKYEGTVPISHIREFIGVLESEKRGVDKGLFITTGSLPSSAYELERNNTKLELIEGEKLVEMFEKAELGVTPRIVYDVDLTFFNQYM